MPYSFFLDFSGGHNDTNSIVKVAPNEGEFYNLNLERDGSFSKRKGSIKQNSVATGATDECGMIFQFKPSATTAKFLVQFGSALKLWDGSAFTDLLTGLTANKVMLPAPFKNLCYFNNNADVPLVYYPDASSGPTVFRAGCPAPTSSPTQGADVAGSLTAGDKFKVRVRYVSKIDGNFMGEPYPEAGVEITVGASGGRTIDNIPVYTPSGIDYEIADRIFERTTAGATPGGTFYEDQRLGDNTTTSADVTQSDTLLLENAIMPDLGARGIPPKLWPFTVYKNRVCGFDPTDFGRFVYSEIDEFGILPEAFPSLNYQYIDVQDFEDAPTAVAVMGEFLVVYCGRSIHLIHIDEAGVSSSRKILTHELGIPNPRAIAVLPSGHLIWTYRGPYLFDLTNLIFIGERIETSIDTIPKSDLDKLYTVVLPQEKRRQVKFCFPSSGSKPDKAAVYHYRRPSLNPDGFPTEHAWTFFDGFESKSGAIVINASTKVFEEYSGSYDGFLYREDIGDSDAHDAGGQIDGKFYSAWLDMQNPHQVKYFTDIWVLVADTSGVMDLALSWETDFGEGVDGAQQLEADFNPPTFGTAVFGTAVFGSSGTVIRHTQLSQDGVAAVGRWIRFQIANNAQNQPWTVIGFIVKWHQERDRNDAIG